MRDRSEIWRLRAWVWLPALLFFLANAVAFSVYRFGYAGQVKSLEADLGAGQPLRDDSRRSRRARPLRQRRARLDALDLGSPAPLARRRDRGRRRRHVRRAVAAERPRAAPCASTREALTGRESGTLNVWMSSARMS